MRLLSGLALRTRRLNERIVAVRIIGPNTQMTRFREIGCSKIIRADGPAAGLNIGSRPLDPDMPANSDAGRGAFGRRKARPVSGTGFKRRPLRTVRQIYLRRECGTENRSAKAKRTTSKARFETH